MPRAIGHHEGVAPDDVAEARKELEEQRRRIGLGMRLDHPHDLACETVEGGLCKRSRIIIAGKPAK